VKTLASSFLVSGKVSPLSKGLALGGNAIFVFLFVHIVKGLSMEESISMDLNIVASGGSEPGRDKTTKEEITFLVECFGHEEFNWSLTARR
jgi:hypothetical protein